MDMEKRKEVNDLLDSLEVEHEMKLLHAVESGSRAWGFESQDSDYDVRFIYVRPKDWYLSVYEKSDVINPVFIDDLDAAGWDVRKCLKLISKGNAVVYEWLNSPVIYRSDDERIAQLKELSEEAFNPLPVYHHYRSLAKRKMLEEGVHKNPKSFLYALRAILSAKWVATERDAPPVAFESLVSVLVNSAPLKEAVSNLIIEKEALMEAEELLIHDGLFSFAAREFEELENIDVKPTDKLLMERYEAVFKKVLER